MNSTRTHFPHTTADQRRLLFEGWEATHNVSESCKRAHVSRQTFYVWLPRFEAESYAGLLHSASRAPKHPHRIAPAIAQRVTALRQQHPSWGKQLIADVLTQENQFVPLVSRGTVRRILVDAGLWPEPATLLKKERG
jgi:transposase